MEWACRDGCSSPSLNRWLTVSFKCKRIGVGVMFHNILPRVLLAVVQDRAVAHGQAGIVGTLVVWRLQFGSFDVMFYIERCCWCFLRSLSGPADFAFYLVMVFVVNTFSPPRSIGAMPSVCPQNAPTRMLVPRLLKEKRKHCSTCFCSTCMLVSTNCPKAFDMFVGSWCCYVLWWMFMSASNRLASEILKTWESPYIYFLNVVFWAFGNLKMSTLIFGTWKFVNMKLGSWKQTL